MTSAALIEDRLTETELKQQEDVARGGVFLYIAERNIEEHEVEFPPTLDEIREMIGKQEVVDIRFQAMPGAVFWVYNCHHGALTCTENKTVMVLYEEHGHLFIQAEVSGLVVVTRFDATGAIKLLSKDEAKEIQKYIRVTGFAA